MSPVSSSLPKKKIPFPPLIGIGLFLTFIVGYSAYWFIASNEINKGILASIDEHRANGYQIEHGPIQIKGFPYRFQIEVPSPKIVTPDQEWTWQGETLQVVMQSYSYNHFIAFAPGQHILEDKNQRIYTTDTDGFQASYVRRGQEIKQISIVAKSLEIHAPQNDSAIVEGGNFHLSSMPENPDDMRIMVGFDKIKLSRPVPDKEFLGTEIGPLSAPIAIKQGMKFVRETGNLPEMVSLFDPEMITPLTQFKWGPLEIKGKTSGIKIDSAHKPAGLLNVRVENIPALRQAMQTYGNLDQESQAALALAEGMMATEDAFLQISLSQGKVKVLFQEVAELEPLF